MKVQTATNAWAEAFLEGARSALRRKLVPPQQATSKTMKSRCRTGRLSDFASSYAAVMAQ
jgi:uncharacterized protein YgiM (DUF1202 family)